MDGGKNKTYNDLPEAQREEILELCLGNEEFAIESLQIDSLSLFVKMGSIYSSAKHEKGRAAALRILQIRMEG